MFRYCISVIIGYMSLKHISGCMLVALYWIMHSTLGTSCTAQILYTSVFLMSQLRGADKG